jgi:hypothetical protein
MMVSDDDGYWTGVVKCDHTFCDKWLSQEKVKRRGLLERGWQCEFGMHHCPDHHKTAAQLPEGAGPYVEAWATRQEAWRRSQGLLPLDPPSTPTT